MLVRLMYASRAVDSMDHAALVTILKQATTHNASIGVTSVLCFANAMFLQVLEGGRTAINKLYRSIVADPRHRDVVLLSYEEIGERRFACWSMGQVTLSRLNPALLMKYSETAQFDPYSEPATVSMALFNELVATASIMGPT